MNAATENFESFESGFLHEGVEVLNEAAPRFRPGRPVFVQGGVSSATLNTPKGPATLNLPAAMATLAQFRALEQVVNSNTQRTNALQTEIARLRAELARRGSGDQMGQISPLLLLFLFNRDDDEDDDDDDFGRLLPLLFLLPGVFGAQATPGQDSAMGMSPLLLALLFLRP